MSRRSRCCRSRPPRHTSTHICACTRVHVPSSSNHTVQEKSLRPAVGLCCVCSSPRRSTASQLSRRRSESLNPGTQARNGKHFRSTARLSPWKGGGGTRERSTSARCGAARHAASSWRTHAAFQPHLRTSPVNLTIVMAADMLRVRRRCCAAALWPRRTVPGLRRQDRLEAALPHVSRARAPRRLAGERRPRCGDWPALRSCFATAPDTAVSGPLRVVGLFVGSAGAAGAGPRPHRAPAAERGGCARAGATTAAAALLVCQVCAAQLIHEVAAAAARRCVAGQCDQRRVVARDAR
jgi:hypothetical protein